MRDVEPADQPGPAGVHVVRDARGPGRLMHRLALAAVVVALAGCGAEPSGGAGEPSGRASR